MVKNVKLGQFRRIVKGDSLRIHSIAPQNVFAPARILDLDAIVDRDEQAVRLSWTAPGEVLDAGRAKDYLIFTSEMSNSFHKRNRRTFMTLPATRMAGGRENYTIPLREFERDVYLAVAAMNRFDNLAASSNVVHIQIPRYQANPNQGLPNQSSGSNSNNNGSNVGRKSDKILFYVLFGVISFILVCALMVVIILKKYQRKRDARTGNSVDGRFSCEDPMDDISVIDVTEEVLVNDFGKQSLIVNKRPPGAAVAPNPILTNSMQQQQHPNYETIRTFPTRVAGFADSNNVNNFANRSLNVFPTSDLPTNLRGAANHYERNNYSLNLGYYNNRQHQQQPEQVLGNSYINVVDPGPASGGGDDDYCDCQAYATVKNPDLICDPIPIDEPIYANTNAPLNGLRVITPGLGATPPIYSVVNKKSKTVKSVEFAESTDSQTTATTNSRNTSPESAAAIPMEANQSNE